MEFSQEQILEAETDLLKSEIRKSSEKINQILANDFIEFSSSGKEYYYKNGDVFQDEMDNTQFNWEIVNFRIKELSSDCILSMYKLIKHNEIDENKKYSLRSSIWKYTNGKWKMFFHQGTITSKF
ncbi:UNVERIFIED_ORG: DUF4440 domain-containing protein [Clostridium botulinum]|uniref:DUF4440 domain-containing protein n=1 Tax=Clostridium botulinum TaxID=1491 RepID=A0A6B4QQY1_CLOBO|nr:DUF4440 domain-containing protein [Clostridium botulinum]MBN1060214.1 DUF4440 domain-containing protein [Clostridium botulinum]MBY6809334.1 DUF4440 domain-containing protein [Clostridium botulinum]MBY6822776.1 DUF4440 domain-containing protein [Clostridium botulinum]MBY6833388.1 DUF4440 domain-containing protein [Clostridium botulinum]MBY6971449.1 DUF4440 domain-containing protein [Clostridium botulinum]